MRLNYRTILLLLTFIPLVGFAQNNTKEKRIYNTTRISQTAPIIDGLIDANIWDQVEWSGDFTQKTPQDGADPSQETAFKILYDDNFLYILVRAYDTEPDKIVKRLSRRDGFDGDWVEINIDSYFDKRTAFSFTASVSGVKSDEAISNDGNRWDRTWDPIWNLKTSIDNEGWIAEIKIPFTQLRFSNHKIEQIWGLQVNRRFFRNEERSHWAYFSQDESGWVRHFGELHGIKNIKPKRQIEISPYIVAKQENFTKESDNIFKDKGYDRSLGYGVDGKIGITNDFTLDFTINPDFGQVEADPSEVNLSAFESYFEEKRPFFIQGREITSYQISSGGNSYALDNLFYSRRIGRSPQYYPDLDDNEYENRPQNTTIWGALKLTGKTRDGLSVGVIETLTSKEKSDIYNSTTKETEKITVEPLTNYLVARVQKDLNDNNTIIGGMLTSTNRFINKNDEHLDFLNTDAYTGGVDLTQYFKDKKYYLTFKYAMSHIEGNTEAITTQQESSRRYFQRPDNHYVTYDTTLSSLNGHAGTIQVGKQGNSKLRWMTWVTWRSPGYESNDVGFLHHSDAIFQVFWTGYRFTEPFSIFRTMNINFNQWSGWDFGANNNFYGGNINLWMQFKNHWSFGGGTNFDGSTASNTMLRGGPSIKTPGSYNYWVNMRSDNRKKLQVYANTGKSWGLENSSERSWYGIDIIYRPIDALKISFLPDYSVSTNEMQYLDTEEFNGDDRYVFAKIKRITTDLTVRVDYSITPDLTIQLYGSPFVSAGNYSNAKYITNPQADKFKDRYSTEMTWSDEDYDTDYDFNFKQFRANAVLRWEYKPGSLLYLVWSPNMTDYDDTNGNFSLSDDMRDLFGTKPNSVFLIKLSYRFTN
ncbi:MAG: carbohydrate binding family 9 domain-containing protein [Bacteroidales bacterium]|nr:carbohydrate binding family 9 domain-containing protein [Bacteroidales bacterium]